jgi:Domain of unknown function (DUF4375)
VLRTLSISALLLRIIVFSLLFAVSLAYSGTCLNLARGDMDPEIEKAIEEFENRTIYRKLNPEILASIPDDKLEQAILDYVWTKVGNNYEAERAIVSSLSLGFMVVHATWGVEAEVNNGGFNQYFWNSAGQFADEAVEGYRAIGAAKHAELVAQAIALERTERDRMAEFKSRGTLEAFSESYESNPLNELDTQFYELDEDPRALRIEFIRSHPDLFAGD